MYLPRPNLKHPPVLAKRCLACGRFLFKRNLGENERYHKVGENLFVCHSCMVKAQKDKMEKEANEIVKGNVEEVQQTV